MTLQICKFITIRGNTNQAMKHCLHQTCVFIASRYFFTGVGNGWSSLTMPVLHVHPCIWIKWGYHFLLQGWAVETKYILCGIALGICCMTFVNTEHKWSPFECFTQYCHPLSASQYRCKKTIQCWKMRWLLNMLRVWKKRELMISLNNIFCLLEKISGQLLWLMLKYPRWKFEIDEDVSCWVPTDPNAFLALSVIPNEDQPLEPL